jgi:FkbM family methyltransferase
MNKIFRFLKLWKDVLMGKELYYIIQLTLPIHLIGSVSCGFFIVPKQLNSNSIVYSFGVGEDISFDEDVIHEFGCPVYAYDPTPKSKIFVEQNKPSALFKYHDCGIADYNGKMKFYLPENEEYVSCSSYNRWGYDENKKMPIEVDVKKLSTLMQENSHTHIDLLKMDIEGSEYAVLDNILKEKIDIKQICVEVHHRFEGIGIAKTKELVRKLNENGYYIVAISDTREEYTFVRK